MSLLFHKIIWGCLYATVWWSIFLFVSWGWLQARVLLYGIVWGFLQFTLLFWKKDVDNNKDKRKVQARTEMRQKNEAHADCGICMQVTLLFVHRWRFLQVQFNGITRVPAGHSCVVMLYMRMLAGHSYFGMLYEGSCRSLLCWNVIWGCLQITLMLLWYMRLPTGYTAFCSHYEYSSKSIFLFV